VSKAQQSLNDAVLVSPIAGTVTAIAIYPGESVSAGSSSETMTIAAAAAYEVVGTLSTAQVPSVKVGESAKVSVDGASQTLSGTVAQVGPVQSGSTGYSYPVVVALPTSAGDLHDGSAANVSIETGKATNDLAVPTSAVTTQGNQSYVLLVSSGRATEHKIETGIVADTYTQVLAGLVQGESVVLADYAQPVPSSNTATTGGFGGFGGGGQFGGGGGGFAGRTGATGAGAG
jgi:RND family efflux transporter MFP subunit